MADENHVAQLVHSVLLQNNLLETSQPMPPPNLPPIQIMRTLKIQIGSTGMIAAFREILKIAAIPRMSTT